MKSSGEIDKILLVPPPRPLKVIIRGPAFIKSVAYLAAAAITIAVGLVNLWYYLFSHYREPLFGNEQLLISYIVFIFSVGGFIFFWSMSFMNIYSVYLFRNGRLKTARVEKSYIQEKSDRKLFIINWIVEEDGKISKGAVSTPVSDISKFRQDVVRGDTLYLLASGKDPGDAMPAGIMGLRKEWNLFPSLAVSAGFSVVRWLSVLWILICAAAALVGFLSSHFIDENVPIKYVVVSAAAGLVVSALFWFAGRGHSNLFRPSWYIWIAAVFVATYFMIFGVIKGMNVWLDRGAGHARKVEVLELDDALFPALHRFAYVRAWRPGRIKEKIPISWKAGLLLSPGDTLNLKIKDGYFNVPAITDVRQ